MKKDLVIYNKVFNNRLFMGTAYYPSLDIMKKSISIANPSMITASIKRQTAQNKENAKQFWQYLKELKIPILPNTAGCTSVDEAINTAYMAKEIFNTDWIKLELIGDDLTLCPNNLKLIEATKILLENKFKVMPYCTEDLIVCKKLVDLGCEVIMPWAAPIGTGIGPINEYGLKNLRKFLPSVKIIIDAGIGLPSHVVKLMEFGMDGILLNTAIAKSCNPIKMSKSMLFAIKSGRLAYESIPMEQKKEFHFSTIMLDKPFWNNN